MANMKQLKSNLMLYIGVYINTEKQSFLQRIFSKTTQNEIICILKTEKNHFQIQSNFTNSAKTIKKLQITIIKIV